MVPSLRGLFYRHHEEAQRRGRAGALMARKGIAMNTEKLIEEADRFYSASTEAMCLVTNLAAALRESKEQNQAIRRALDWERAEREEVHDELAAANLAANKRIEALEHERDASRAELARLTTPRPIAEAPRTNSTQIIALWMHGDEVESMDVVVWANMDDGEHPERKFWMNMAGDSVEDMTHYLPLPEVKP